MKFFALAVFGAAVVSAHSPTAPLEARTRKNGIDICTSTNINVGSQIAQATGHSLRSSLHKTDVCICISTIASFIKSNPDAAYASQKLGYRTVSNALASIIYSHSPKACSTPWNASPVCTPNNPCAFRCHRPFVLSSNKKSCVLPSSAKPKSIKRSEEAIFKSADVCPTNHLQCRVWNSLSAFECVDTQTDLFSCGGCVHGGVEGEAEGRDCSAIEGVSDVGCVASKCEIRKCSNGWKLSENGESCVRA